MKRKLYVVLFGSLLLVALCAAEATQGVGVVRQKTPSVAGTEWVGMDTPDNLITTYRFERGGVVAYYYNGTTYRNGTWTQDGDRLYFELNNKYRECRATINGDLFEGDSWNVKGSKWKTTLYRYHSPD